MALGKTTWYGGAPVPCAEWDRAVPACGGTIVMSGIRSVAVLAFLACASIAWAVLRQAMRCRRVFRRPWGKPRPPISGNTEGIV